MTTIDWSDWQRWREGGHDRLPLVAVVEDARLPAEWTGFWDEPVSVLLESGRTGRYTILCDRINRLLTGWETYSELSSRSGGKVKRIDGAPLSVLRQLMDDVRAPGLPAEVPPIAAGWLTLMGYDLVRTWEHLPQPEERDRLLPWCVAVEPRDLFVFDHETKKLFVTTWTDVTDGEASSTLFAAARGHLDEACLRWKSGGSGAADVEGDLLAGETRSSFSRAEFEQAVRAVKDYIAAGHSYQVNLSLCRSRPCSASPGQVYEALRTINPSPYMGLFRTPGFSLVCGSPELLVKLDRGRIRSRPIAGTRPRGIEDVHDQSLSAELIANEKERAEHLMLVDLIRNDIGRVAEYGSVRVSEFMAIERYSHVMHIVSDVEGRIRTGESWDSLFRSMFPGGTITGCPKVRTMEIIDELESVGRGYYTGSLGWVTVEGEMELNIVIRSILIRAGRAYVQAGAGIVADSDPSREYDEVARKADAMWQALDRFLPTEARE